MSRFKFFLLLTTTALCTAPLAAQAAPGDVIDLVLVGDLPGGYASSWVEDISADGTTLVGAGNGANGGDEAFLWTQAGGWRGLGDLAGGSYYSEAYAVSGDGSIVVGYSNGTNGDEAFRWTQGTGMVGLGYLAGGNTSQAYGISSNGQVIVGYSESTNGIEAFRWTQAGGMVGLGDLPGGNFEGYADSVSADGSVIVGESNGTNGTEAFRWTQATGMVGLGDLTGGGYYSSAFGMNESGSAIVGRSDSANGTEAFRWTQADGMVGLGDLAGGGFDSYANAVSADGKIVVGKGETSTGSAAFIWREGIGMTSLADDLSNIGTDLTGWTLISGTAITPNGGIIVGNGSYNGDTIVFLVNLESSGITTPDNLSESLNTVANASQQATNMTAQFIPQTLFLARNINSIATPIRSVSYPTQTMAYTPASIGDIAPAAGGDAFFQSRASIFMLGSYGTDSSFKDNQYNGTVGINLGVTPALDIGVGVIGSTARTDLSFEGDSKADALGGLIITSYQPNDSGLRIYGTAYGSHLSLDTKRGYMNGSALDSSDGKTEGMSYGAAVRLGWEENVFNDETSLMPYIEARYSKTKLDAYTEKNGAFASSFSEQNNDNVSSRLGVEIKHKLTETLDVLFRPAWGHRISGEGTAIQATTSGIVQNLQNNESDRDWAEASLGGTWRATPQIQLSTELTGRTGDTAEPVATMTFGAFIKF